MAYLVFHILIKIINYKWKQNIDIFRQKTVRGFCLQTMVKKMITGYIPERRKFNLEQIK